MYTLDNIASTMNTFHNIIGHDIIENVTGKPPVFVNELNLKLYISFLQEDSNNIKSLIDTIELNNQLYNAASAKRKKRAKRYYNLYNEMFNFISERVYKKPLS